MKREERAITTHTTTKKNGIPQHEFYADEDLGILSTSFIHKSKYDGIPETTIFHKTDAVCLKDIIKCFETFLRASGFRWAEGTELCFVNTTTNKKGVQQHGK
jgi:hypothetical protein